MLGTQGTAQPGLRQHPADRPAFLAPGRGDCFHGGHLWPAQHIPQAYLVARPAGLCPPTQEAAPRGAPEEFQGPGGGPKWASQPPFWGWREPGIEWQGRVGRGIWGSAETGQADCPGPRGAWISLRRQTSCPVLGTPPPVSWKALPGACAWEGAWFWEGHPKSAPEL